MKSHEISMSCGLNPRFWWWKLQLFTHDLFPASLLDVSMKFCSSLTCLCFFSRKVFGLVKGCNSLENLWTTWYLDILDVYLVSFLHLFLLLFDRADCPLHKTWIHHALATIWCKYRFTRSCSTHNFCEYVAVLCSVHPPNTQFIADHHRHHHHHHHHHHAHPKDDQIWQIWTHQSRAWSLTPIPGKRTASQSSAAWVYVKMVDLPIIGIIPLYSRHHSSDVTNWGHYNSTNFYDHFGVDKNHDQSWEYDGTWRGVYVLFVGPRPFPDFSTGAVCKEKGWDATDTIHVKIC